MVAIVLLDIDGVLNSSEIAASSGGFADTRRVMVGEIEVWLSAEMWRRLEALPGKLRWMSSWQEDDIRVLETVLGREGELEITGLVDRGDYTSWKMLSLEAELARMEGWGAFVWVDDDAFAGERAEVVRGLAKGWGVEVLLVQPEARLGVSPEQMEEIEAFCARHSG